MLNTEASGRVCRARSAGRVQILDHGENAGATGAGAAANPSAAPRPGSQEDLVANVGDRVFFDTDSSSIRSDQRAVLERQAAWLQKYPAVTVQVEGHADERGTREYNLALGQRRANAARDVLVAGGTARDRASRPSPMARIVRRRWGSSEDAWAQNRRAVTVVR